MKSPQPPDSGAAAGPELHVHSVEDDRWTWCYVEPASGIELFSNETYSTAEGAADYARRAYPEVPFAEDKKSAEEQGP